MQICFLYTSLMKYEKLKIYKNKIREKTKQPYLVQQTQRQEQSPTKHSKNMDA